ncbi:DUF427 domain-containing protein [Methylobacterium haplocladii]|uniref:DUF427 domain-containing protein n=1 Tax=Methylobacterium haplocladii TaxID=1176176 RepID=A0A512IS01_9HYPH|nr:DUF427 domain-containing protein [Methylobacterium haplocladii]GEP00492.1 hypothetical protein MHA02_28790 [Methylobacterium haplocladii]GJD82486.1 hypothetical protein HPGCJGGD_0342 [Methylobacterium haplocladii]GLS59571.1 hypothetical protein GCM10007887_22400 [Methylobacterium haplocladii]
MKQPGPDHPITITPHATRVRIVVDGTVVAETTRALALKEARYPAVFYIPRADVNWALFIRNPRVTHCPYKGDASYYDLTIDGATKAAAVWSYEAPFPAVAAIKDHLAFYPDKVDAIEEMPA